MGSLIGNMTIISKHENGFQLKCSHCDKKFSIPPIKLDSAGEPVELHVMFGGPIKVKGSDGNSIICHWCQGPWILPFKIYGNMGYRVESELHTHIKCHCQCQFIRTVELDCGRKPVLDGTITCPDCQCRWTTPVGLEKKDKWFIGSITIEGKEFPIVVAQERSLRAFIMLYTHIAFELAESSIEQFRAIETTEEEAKSIIRKHISDE